MVSRDKDSGFEVFKRSFRPDKRFWWLLLWEFLLVLALSMGVYVWALQMTEMTPLMERALAPYSSETPLGQYLSTPDAEAAAVELRSRTIVISVIIILFMLVAWFLFKSLGYCALVRRKMSWKTFVKFIPGVVFWSLLLALIVLLLRLVVDLTIFDSLGYSAASRAVLLIGMVVSAVLLTYFTILFFIAFTRYDSLPDIFGKFVRVAFRSFRKNRALLLYTLLMFVILNVVMAMLSILPGSAGVLLNAAMVLLFIVWLKFYYNICFERLLASRAGSADGLKRKKK